MLAPKCMVGTVLVLVACATLLLVPPLVLVLVLEPAALYERLLTRCGTALARVPTTYVLPHLGTRRVPRGRPLPYLSLQVGDSSRATVATGDVRVQFARKYSRVPLPQVPSQRETRIDPHSILCHCPFTTLARSSFFQAMSRPADGSVVGSDLCRARGQRRRKAAIQCPKRGGSNMVLDFHCLGEGFTAASTSQSRMAPLETAYDSFPDLGDSPLIKVQLKFSDPNQQVVQIELSASPTGCALLEGGTVSDRWLSGASSGGFRSSDDGHQLCSAGCRWSNSIQASTSQSIFLPAYPAAPLIEAPTADAGLDATDALVEEVDCTAASAPAAHPGLFECAGIVEDGPTVASGGRPQTPCTDDKCHGASSSGRKGGFWGTQRVLGMARSLCRWLLTLRKACGVVLSCGTDLVATGNCLVAASRLGPGLVVTLWPAVSWVGAAYPVQGTYLCSGSAVVCLLFAPWVARGAGAVQRAVGAGAEAIHSLFACRSRIGESISHLRHNSLHMVNLLSSTVLRRSLPFGSSKRPDLLAAADFGFTAAAFLHMWICSAVRWCKGTAPATVYKAMPEDMKVLGTLAKVMYDPELPGTVEMNGRTLRLLPQFTDAVMAVYASEELVNGDQKMPREQGHIVVSHRGTWSARDLLDDLHLLCGTFRSSPRYKDAWARTSALLRIWPDCKYTHVGHSLGGAVAMAMAQRLPQHLDVEAHAFNPGISFEGFTGPRSTIHIIERDFIPFCTAAHPGANCKIYPAHNGVKYLPLWGHPHSVYNFAELEGC